MNDEHETTPEEQAAHRLLDDVIPPAPPTTGWADGAARGARGRRTRIAGLGVAALVAGAIPVGLWLLDDGPLEAVPQPAATITTVPSTEPAPVPSGPVELVGAAMLLEDSTSGGPMLCWGMLQSLPPHCSGPVLQGDFSWDDVEHDETSGVRWTNEMYEFHGYLDIESGDLGTFTMTRPVQPHTPVPTVEPQPAFPQLCEDMLMDADSSKTGMDDVNRLAAVLQPMASVEPPLVDVPVVASWVSNGRDAYNILVQGDAQEAFDQLRTVWGGELCVESSEAPTAAEREAALNRILQAAPSNQFVSGSGGSGMEPVVGVSVIVATPEIESMIREAAGDIDVEIHAVFKPVGEEADPGQSLPPASHPNPGIVPLPTPEAEES